MSDDLRVPLRPATWSEIVRRVEALEERFERFLLTPATPGTDTFMQEAMRESWRAQYAAEKARRVKAEDERDRRIEALEETCDVLRAGHHGLIDERDAALARVDELQRIVDRVDAALHDEA